MLQFHNESKPSLFDYVLRISINQKANTNDDFRDSPYVTEILYPISDQEIQLPKTFQGIGLFFFTDVKDKYLTKGHPRYELQWTEYSSFSFCLTDEKKNIYFVFAYLHSSSVYCVISDYYHPAFLSDFIYVLSISKNPSGFAQRINNIVIRSSNQQDDEQFYQDDESIFVHDQYDWFFKVFQSDNSDSGSNSAYSLPIQGPRSTSSSNLSKNNKIQLLSSRKMSNLSTAKINASKISDFSNHLYGISHTNHMSPDNEICELYKFIFSDLPVEYILMLIDAILLDFKIIIISNDVAKLGKAAFAIIGLIYPLKWPGSFIPVCPESMSTFLEAPFPYIIGIHSSLSMKLLEGDNMIYCVYNVDAHYVANIGIEDFPPNVLNYIDLVAEKIKTIIHSYSPLFPFVHVQREIRNFIKGTLANSYGLDPNDFGYKELMADFVVWRDESSSEYAAYFSQSQTVDNFMRSLENSEYEKDDRVFKAFFPNETFMGTVHIPRQLVEESIEKEKEDGIKINIADLQMLSKSYPKTAVKVNNDRLVSFDSSNTSKQKEDASPKKNDNQNIVQIKIESNNSSTNASDSESSHKSSSKRKHKHKRHITKTLRSSMPISNASDLDDKLRKEAETDYPIKKNFSSVNINSDDDSLSVDENINIEKIIRSDDKKIKNKKKYRNSSRVNSPVSTFSVDSASDADQTSSTSESEDSKKQLKSKKRVPPDLPAIPSKKPQAEPETKKKSTKKKKDRDEKKGKKKSTTAKNSKSKSKSDNNSESESEKKSQKQKVEKKTILIIESDSDVSDSLNNDSFANSDDDSGNWSSSSSSPPEPKKSKEVIKSKLVEKRNVSENDSDGFSSSSSNSNKTQTKKTGNKTENHRIKKRKPYKFDSDSESNNNDDNSVDYESESNKIHQNENESVLRMMKKSKISDSDSDDENSHSFIDSPIPKKKSKYAQESDLKSYKGKSKSKKLPNRNEENSSNDDNNENSDESDDLNEPSLKKKYKKSSDMNQSQIKSKRIKKRKNKYNSDSDDDESNNSSNSDNSN